MTIKELLILLDPVIYVLGITSLFLLCTCSFLFLLWTLIKRFWKFIVGIGAVIFIVAVLMLLMQGV